MDDNQIKDYLQRHGIKSVDGLVSHIEELKKNTIPKTDLISELVWILHDKESVFYSFLCENFINQVKENNNKAHTASEGFYDAFVKFNSAEKEIKNKPFFIDEVVNDLQIKEVVQTTCDKINEVAGFKWAKPVENEIPEHKKIIDNNDYLNFLKSFYTGSFTYKVPKEGYRITFNPNNKGIETMITEKIGVKETENKTDYSEIDFDILDLMAERFNANKHKYPKGNMLKPIEEKELLFAGLRHLKKMIQPLENDEETFVEHLSAVLCNMQMLYQQRKLNKC